MAALTAGAAGLHVIADGSGPEVLLVGGLLDDARAWDALAAPLVGAGRRVVRYDVRGTGRSLAPPGRSGVSELVGDARSALEAAEAADVDLVGASLGALVALHLAAEEPERVRSLTLIGGWLIPDRALRALLTSWGWAAEQSGSAGALAQAMLRWTHGPGARNAGLADDAVVAAERAAAVAGAPSWRAARRAFFQGVWAALHHDASAAAAAVNAPALVVVGEHDIVAGPRHARALHAALADSRLAVVADAGHRVAQEQPGALAALLAEHLAPVAAGVR